MKSTKAAAEKAALEGDVEDWDTQKCLELQEQILSSSLPHPTDAVASNLDGTLSVPGLPEKCDQDDGIVIEETPQQRESVSAEVDKELPADAADVGLPQNRLVSWQSQTAKSQVFFRRDSNNRLRRFDSQGNECLGSDFDEKHQAAFAEIAATMDDLTQKSSMSLTQENAESAYVQFDMQKIISGQNPAEELTNDDAAPPPATNSLHSKHQSVMTDSTAHTYGENDTGYIKLDYNPEPLLELDDEQESQDASYTVPHVNEYIGGHSFGPQTPAQPINPFSQKGSVMKEHELFGATQPSSIGRNFASPTSSRPSPDVYNDFTTPQRRMVSSPLVRGPRVGEISPLQSSVRHILTSGTSVDSPQITIPRTPGIQSFDLGPTMPQSRVIRGPRAYTSMKESQERRRLASLNQQDSNEDSDGSISSIEEAPKRRRNIDQDIQRQLSAVELRRPMPSSRPRSSSLAVVQVPSTGRRRNVEGDYVAQCEGFDARDSEQDVIADSQMISNHGLPDYAEDEAQREKQTVNGLEAAITAASQLDKVSASRSTSSTDHQPESLSHSHPDPPGPSPQPTLPLQGLTSNQSKLRTPTANKNQPQSDATVPETSRAEDRIRPMQDVASFSHEQEDEALQGLPGFTQDPEFESAIGLQQSPEPPRTFLRTQKNENSQQTEIRSSPPAVSAQERRSTPVEPDISDAAEPRIERPTANEHEDTSNFGGLVIDTNKNPGSGEARNTQSIPSPRKPEEYSTAPEFEETNQSVSNNNETETETQNLIEPKAPAPESPPSTAKRSGLRSKAQMKGPSSALRRSAALSTPKSTPRPSGRVSRGSSSTKSSTTKSLTSAAITPSATLPGKEMPQVSDSGPSATSKRRSNRKSGLSATPIDAQTPEPAPVKRTSKRKSGPTSIDYNEQSPPTRSFKRQLLGQPHTESSEDPLAMLASSARSASKLKEGSKGIFGQMAFAVSYVSHDHDRNHATRLILDNGGQILQDGFDCLFENTPLTRAKPLEEDMRLTLTPVAKSIGFTALIADEHSRKAKYMQALALGLPCISGQWISMCVSKCTIIDWSPYLLCAGRSSVLGNACRSRILRPYSAVDASLVGTFEGREKLLDGKSILLVLGKGKMGSRKAYIFLTRALGPARVGQVADLAEARKKLVDSDTEGQGWDLLYVESHEEAAEGIVFGPGNSAAVGGSRKRKRLPTPKADGTPAPKRIRVISDEVVVQSLILGQILEA